MLHKSLRIAALLARYRDVSLSATRSTTPIFATATIERATEKRAAIRQKDLPNSHEHLGSFIIKNTDYEGGLTQILEHYGFDVKMISKIIKGDSPHLIANQLMHSDLDADRMDYLLRDSHYTGIKYGQFDREYILANLVDLRCGRRTDRVRRARERRARGRRLPDRALSAGTARSSRTRARPNSTSCRRISPKAFSSRT